MRTMNSLASPLLAVLLVTGVIERVNCQSVDPTKALATLQEKVLSKVPMVRNHRLLAL